MHWLDALFVGGCLIAALHGHFARNALGLVANMLDHRGENGAVAGAVTYIDAEGVLPLNSVDINAPSSHCIPGIAFFRYKVELAIRCGNIINPII